jgi:soluble lytic murein transglycosylase-like protein
MIHNKSELCAIVADTATAEGIDPAFIMACVDVLSSWSPALLEQSPDPMAYNPALGRNNAPGSRIGLLQVNPEAVKELGFTETREQLFEPTFNVSVGCRLLKKALEQTGNNADRALLVCYGYSVASLIPTIRSKVAPYREFLAMRPV